MGEIVRFAARSEVERARLIREARAIYDAIFPPVAPLGERQRRELSYASGLAEDHRDEKGFTS